MPSPAWSAYSIWEQPIRISNPLGNYKAVGNTERQRGAGRPDACPYSAAHLDDGS